MTRRRRGQGERGAALVELGLLLPLLILLAFGGLELSTTWVAGSRVHSATAQAARFGAASGDRPTTDRDLLVALRAALPPAELQHLDRVIVFKASSPSGTIPAACMKPFGSGTDATAMWCNSYSGATVRATSSLSMIGFGGSPGSKDAGWAPASRAASLQGPPDYIGLWVRVRHEGVTQTHFADLTITSRSVFRIQPDISG
jgi:hypothetical protein